MAKKLGVRIDDRLIHGQVVTQWVNVYSANKIVVIDDDVAKNSMQKKILKFAAPPNMKVNIYSTEKAAEEWKKNKFGDYNVFVLFRNVFQIRKLMDMGVKFDEITIGQMSIIDNRKQVYRQVGFSKDEADCLLKIHKDGVDIYFQMLPTDKKVTIDIVTKTYPDLK